MKCATEEVSFVFVVFRLLPEKECGKQPEKRTADRVRNRCKREAVAIEIARLASRR